MLILKLELDFALLSWTTLVFRHEPVLLQIVSLGHFVAAVSVTDYGSTT